jgi:hypothetical protein
VNWWRARQRRRIAEKAAEAVRAREQAEQTLVVEKQRLSQMSARAESLIGHRTDNDFRQRVTIAWGGR